MVETCRNCDAPLVGPYCHECGQVRAQRITWATFAHRFWERYLDIEGGMPHTIWSMVVRPGATVRAYLNGQRASFSDPVKLLLISISASTLLLLNTDVMTHFTMGVQEGMQAQSAESKKFGEDFSATLLSYMQVWLLLFVPFQALFGWLIFKNRNYNLAETLMLSCFTYSTQVFIGIPFWVVAALSPGEIVPTIVWSSMAITTVYFVYALISFYRPRLVVGIIQAMATFILSYMGFMFLMIIGTGAYLAYQIKTGKMPFPIKKEKPAPNSKSAKNGAKPLAKPQ